MILDGTPAVLSPGTPCEEHGCTSGWASGTQPRLDKFMHGKLRTSLSSLDCPQILVRVHPLQDSSSTSSSTPSERSHEPAPGNRSRYSPKKTQNKKKRKDINRASDDCLRNLLEWLEEFTESRRYRSACTHFS